MASPTRATTLTRDSRLVTLHSTDLAETYETAASIEDRGGQVMHLYGSRVMIGRIPGQQTRSITARSAVDGIYAAPVRSAPAQLSPAEALGLAAWNLRQSSPYQRSKARRPRDGDLWQASEGAVAPDGHGMQHTGASDVLGAPARAFEDMSPYLIGSVAVGLILVEGPGADLQFSDAERLKVVAEVQEGLTWLGSQEPRASITWAYDLHTVRVNVTPDPTLSGYEPLEALWRDPAMGQLGFAENFQGVHEYVAAMRNRLGTRWGYVAYFTKYPVHHFAYASKPRLVMHFQNDGWGPDNIDRVFTHETGHIFGCPDEYAESQCSCTTRYGFLQEVNGNCESCAGTFVSCLMARNDWAMCEHTRVHLGWRDSDNDGTLDPVDPVERPVIPTSRLCRRFPALCDLLHGPATAAAAPPAPDAFHESVPLFLLRRILTAKEMARVEAAMQQEEHQYLEALARKLTVMARVIKPS